MPSFATLRQYWIELGLGWIPVAQALAAACGLIQVLLVVRKLAIADFGHYALAMTLITIGTQVASGPIANGVCRFLPIARSAGNAHQLNVVVRGIGLRASLVLSIIIVIAMVVSAVGLLSLETSIVAAAGGALLVQGVSQVIESYDTGLGRKNKMALNTTVSAVSKVAVMWGALELSATSLSAIVALIVAAVAYLTYLTTTFRASSAADVIPLSANQQPAPIYSREKFVDYVYPNAIWGSIAWIQNSSERWWIEILRGTAEVGIYAAIYQLAYYPFSMIAGTISQAIQPQVFARAGRGESVAIRSASKFLVRVCVLWALLASILIIPTVYVARGFLAATVTVDPTLGLFLVGVTATAFACGQFGSLLLSAAFRNHVLMRIKIYTAVMGIALGGLFTANFGFIGMCWACATTSIFYLGLIILEWRSCAKSS